MTPAAGAGPDPARSLALEILRRVGRGAFLSPTLRRSLDASGLEGASRSLVTSLCYGTLRHLPRLEAALAPRLADPEALPEEVRWALRLGAYELLVRGTPPHAAVDTWVEIVKAHARGLAGLANAVLRRLEPAAHAPGSAADLALEPWLLAAFEEALGPERAAEAARAMLEDGPLWLTAFSARAEDVLRADGCDVAAGPLTNTLRVRSPVPVDRLAAFRDGLVQPQNPSSSLPARLFGDLAGRTALDLAAGGGVKTAQLAAAGALVTAVDLDERKARAAAANLRRLGLDAGHVRVDLRDAAGARARLVPADAVLLDAPCSGSGTLRGHPEIKLRLRPEDVRRLAQGQAAMLDLAADLVRPGGTLVYAVCSMTPSEGREQIEALLARRTDLEGDLPELELPHVSAPGLGAYVLPIGGLDGFFVARLRRAEAPAAELGAR